MKGELPANWAEHAAEAIAADQRKRRNHRHPQGFAERHQCAGSGAAGIPRRFGRPDRFQPDQLDRRASRSRQEARQLHQLRRARIRHVAHHERHGAARRSAAVRRHLPDVLGICPQRPAHVGTDEAARDLCVHPRLHRSGRRRPDPPAGRANRDPALHPQHGCMASLRHGRIRRCPGCAAVERKTGPICH